MTFLQDPVLRRVQDPEIKAPVRHGKIPAGLICEVMRHLLFHLKAGHDLHRAAFRGGIQIQPPGQGIAGFLCHRTLLFRVRQCLQRQLHSQHPVPALQRGAALLREIPRLADQGSIQGIPDLQIAPDQISDRAHSRSRARSVKPAQILPAPLDQFVVTAAHDRRHQPGQLDAARAPDPDPVVRGQGFNRHHGPDLLPVFRHRLDGLLLQDLRHHVLRIPLRDDSQDALMSLHPEEGLHLLGDPERFPGPGRTDEDQEIRVPQRCQDVVVQITGQRQFRLVPENAVDPSDPGALLHRRRQTVALQPGLHFLRDPAVHLRVAVRNKCIVVKIHPVLL